MKLMYEDNYPDNVSSMDPHFNYPDPVFDANEVRYAKVNYTAIDSEQDYEEFDETLYVINSIQVHIIPLLLSMFRKMHLISLQTIYSKRAEPVI